MNKLTEVMNKLISPIAMKLSSNKYFLALRDGMSATIPIIVFGSILMLIPNFPFLNNVIGDEGVAVIKRYIGHSYDITMNLTALLISFTISYNFVKRERMEGMAAGLSGLISFLIITPILITDDGVKAISLNVTGSTGLFLGMVCGLVSGKLYTIFFKKGWTIKMPESVPEAVSRSFASLIPLTLIFSIFTIVRIIFLLTPYGNAMDFVFAVLQAPMMKFGGTLGSSVAAAVLNSFIWFFGIHPGGIIGSVYSPILMALSQENFNMVANGLAPTNIINQQFYVVFFEAVGGSLLYALILLFVTKRKDYREIGKIGLPASIFNIGEPIGFGLPTILNPYLIVPSLITAATGLIIGYYATVANIIPICINNVPWTTPVVLGGILSTGSIMGGVIQLVIFILNILIFIPFIKVMEANQNKQDALLMKESK